MGRPRKFDEDEVLEKVAALFASLGFNATGLDDLIRETGLQRGSIYAAFGSKRGLFVSAIRHALTPGWQERHMVLDLMIVALKELAASDQEVKEICLKAIMDVWESDLLDASRVFGQRLLENLEK